VISSRDDIERLFTAQWTRQLGTTVGNGYERLKFIRTKARQLTDHFDTTGWPETEEEVLPYIQRTIERYG